MGVCTTVVSAATRVVSAAAIGGADVLTESVCTVAGRLVKATAAVDDAVRAVESFAPGAAGFGLAGGKRSCVTAMTISDRNSARKKRLSIRERDHSRRRGTGDSEAAG